MFNDDKYGHNIKVSINLDSQEELLIKGCVFSSRGSIKNACVQITSIDYEPITHVYTDCRGRFYINQPVPCMFRIIVSAKNYRTYSSEILDKRNIRCPIKIKLKSELCKSIIVGKIVNSKGNAIPYVKVSLGGSNKYTFSNKNGEFILDNMNRGCYLLKFSSSFYKDYNLKIKVDRFGVVWDIKSIVLENKSYTGTVNGVIYDEENKPIEGAMVLLRKEENDEIIEYTYTNENGVYLFGYVPLGAYYVMANK